MKVMLLANANSIHTKRWAIALAKRDVEIFLFTLSRVKETKDYVHFKNITLFEYGFSEAFTKHDSFGVAKIKYLYVLPALKKMIHTFQPDILHAHYASGYGTLGALSGFSPFLLSVWGSDIYDFPQKSFFHKKLIKYNLEKADKILSTSHTMAREIKLYTDQEVEVTPFGIDLEKFKPMKGNTLFQAEDIVIGTVKTLEEKYGVEYLIRAFKILSDKFANLPLKLLIVGDGELKQSLIQLTKELMIENKTFFTGAVSYDEVPKFHNMITIPVFMSIFDSESFGVAIIEASACAKPVIVSKIGGLPEVVEDGVTGIVVPYKDPKQTALAIEKLLLDDQLYTKMGESGRKRVEKFYDWKNNVDRMIEIYKDIAG